MNVRTVNCASSFAANMHDTVRKMARKRQKRRARSMNRRAMAAYIGSLVIVVAVIGAFRPHAYVLQSPFPDVAAEHPHAGAIIALKNAGILQGKADGLFHPDISLNRAEFVTLVARAVRQNAIATCVAHASFRDVSSKIGRAHV